MSKHTSSSAVIKHDRARRAFLGAGLGLGLTLMAVAAGLLAFPGAARAQDAAQKLADHFSSVKTMTGEFIQFGHNGEQKPPAKFSKDRPGQACAQLREAPSAVRVIAGRQGRGHPATASSKNLGISIHRQDPAQASAVGIGSNVALTRLQS